MKTKLVWVTPKAESVMAYCARVSNPSNQDNYTTAPNLLKYCIKNQHWSIFEMASMCVEITTSRAISAQILRHRSFSFQEFSQRYAEVLGFEIYEARRQDIKNRQNSIDDMSKYDREWFKNTQDSANGISLRLYDEAIRRGIAKECARFLLPMSTTTTLYMSGTVRSWIHYLNLRCANGTQLEHKEIADSIRAIFIKKFPILSTSLEWE